MESPSGGTLLCIPLANLFVVLHVDYIEERRRIGNLVVLGKTDASRYAPSIKSKRGESFLSRARTTSLHASVLASVIRGESILDSVLVRLSPFKIQWKSQYKYFTVIITDR